MTNDENFLAGQFEANRAHLRAVAYRMLGSPVEADDAVQETWLRLNRTGGEEIQNLSGWLTTVVSRVCLDMLRARQAHREEALEEEPAVTPIHAVRAPDPEKEAVMADSVGLALMVVLDRLEPVERLAFVLHDLFDVPFDEIANIVGRSLEATRQIASRARRRVRGLGSPENVGIKTQRRVAEQFLAALRAGDIEGIVAVLDPNLVFRADRFSAAHGTAVEIHGARAWAEGAVAYAAAARFTGPALINGAVGLVLVPHGQITRVLVFTFEGDRIVAAEAIGDPERLKGLEISALA